MADHRTRTRDRRLRRVNQITAAGLLGGAALTAVWSNAAARSSSGNDQPAQADLPATVPATIPPPLPPETATAPTTTADPRPAPSTRSTPTTRPSPTHATTSRPTTTQPQVTTATRQRRHGAVSGGS